MNLRPCLLPAVAIALFLVTGTLSAGRQEDSAAGEGEAATPAPPSPDAFRTLRARSIGPALTSGRISDFAVDPNNRSRYFAAAASGGVWRTTTAGTTWTPVFDGEGSYSIGCLAMDPRNTNVIWVGTGENNSQRSVSYGDGVYRSRDGGSSWTNMGLKESEHIGMITIHPRDSDTVYVAAQGPLWRSGGDRGLYKTTDGGATWQRILHISDDTGVNEVHLDPRDPNVIYASSYQRRRRVWTLINGGPESAIYKSTDAGATWRKITRGLPGGDLGRIGMDIAPGNPDVIYAIVEAASGGGFYRSTNRGETWQRRSDKMTTSPQYYNELVCDPHDVDRVYVLDTVLSVTEDGGSTFQSVPRRGRHVDDHALWIDPDNTDYLLVGCDGGVYDSYDRGGAWSFKENLPLTQFYRVAVDNSEPFYFVYGGTQDNNTLGGPSRTKRPAGILNEDWFITVGGDGFGTQIDPEDPNIVYSQWQYGGLVRYDRRSGETLDIKPRERPGDEPYRWNWDSPLLISPHDPRRLFFGAQRLFQSDDGGVSWEPISEDLTRGLDRNALEVMGRIQPLDAVAKHNSTSIFGNLVALDESPLEEGLIYVGTDDGLIQVTEDGGGAWRAIRLFPGVPDLTYISDVYASRHDVDTVFASFDNHKSGDFAPYLLKSTDRGETWESIAGNLPDRNYVHAVAQDHVNPNLLFVGAEFGAYYTVDGGAHWTKIGGLPTIGVFDLVIQERENDLVMATFGRGFYIVDDYSPMQTATADMLKEKAYIFPIKPALRYIQTGRRGSRGASFYSAANPSYGAVFTYHVNVKLKTLRDKRLERSRGDDAPYPTVEELRAEERERSPRVFLTIRDEDGAVIRRLDGSRSKGLHRATWDLRHASDRPISGGGGGRFFGGGGPAAVPGTYTVEVAQDIDGEVTVLAEPAPFEIVALDDATFTDAEDRLSVLAFRRKASRLRSAVSAAVTVAGDAQTRLGAIRQAILQTPAADPALTGQITGLETRLADLMLELTGDRLRGRLNEPQPRSLQARIGSAVSGQSRTSSPPTQTMRDDYAFAADAFPAILEQLEEIVLEEIPDLEAELEEIGAPWTPGRFPTWDPDDD